MKKALLVLLVIAGGSALLTTSCSAPAKRRMVDDIKSPEEFFGHRMGADRTLAKWPKIVEYFQHLDKNTNRLKTVELGKTTLGKPFLMVLISTPGNLKNADRYRAIAKELIQGRLEERKARELAREGKTICYISCNLHSTEIGSSQTAPELAYRLTQGEVDLRNVIVVLMPSINPDGQVMISEWYDKYVGTKWEGGPMPKLYHHYAGHDNNRDFYFNNLAETRMISNVYYHDWNPHVITDHHQMGSTSGRMFVPPYDDPVAERLHPLVTRWNNVYGMMIALDMEEQGLYGVTHQKVFSSYWMGGSQRTPFWQNRIGLLIETASCRIASPLKVDKTELRSTKPEIVSPKQWQGGTWRLRDIVDYQLACSFSIIRTSNRHKEAILLDSWRMARDSVDYGLIRGAEMHVSGEDKSALDELRRVLNQLNIKFSGRSDEIHIPLAVPQSRMILELFGRQTYPAGDKPYDVVSWTLSWLMGLDHEIRKEPCANEKRVELAPAGDPRDTGIFREVNRALKEGKPVFRSFDGTFKETDKGVTWKIAPFRLGLYQPSITSMDEGWTRLILEKFEFPYTSVHNDRMKKGDLRKDFDCIILPDMSATAIEKGRTGKIKRYPPKFQGGIGKKGVDALKKFVDEGGTLICFDSSTELAMNKLGLPVRNTLKDDTTFSCPGSILNCTVDTSHFIGLGMPKNARLFFARSPILQTSIPPRVDIGRRIVVRYPEKGKLLESGYLNQPEKLRGRAALVEVTMGKGRVVLFGFRPQHRAQSWGTFKLLFNSILLSTAKPMK